LVILGVAHKEFDLGLAEFAQPDQTTAWRDLITVGLADLKGCSTTSISADAATGTVTGIRKCT
jgi:hypothetical protein